MSIESVIKQRDAAIAEVEAEEREAIDRCSNLDQRVNVKDIYAYRKRLIKEKFDNMIRKSGFTLETTVVDTTRCDDDECLMCGS